MRAIETRRLEDKERRSEQILDAAEQVLLAKGFEAAKMDDIAVAARVSRALLYIYFRDKNELQFGLCLRGLKMLKERFAAITADKKRGLDRVTAIGRAYIGFCQEFPVYFAAFSRFELHRVELQNEASTEHRVMLEGMSAQQLIIEALQAGQQDGSVRELPNPVMVAMMLWGFTHGIVQLAQSKGEVFGLLGFGSADFLEQSIVMLEQSLAPAAKNQSA